MARNRCLLLSLLAFIATQIRLGFLCEMVIVCGLLCVSPGGLADGWIAGVAGPSAPISALNGSALSLVNSALQAALWVYLALLPVAHAGLYYNFYATLRLPPALQRGLERYTNLSASSSGESSPSTWSTSTSACMRSRETVSAPLDRPARECHASTTSAR